VPIAIVSPVENMARCRDQTVFFFESCVPLTAWFVYNVTVHLVHFGRGAHGNQEKLAAKLDLYEKKKIKMKKKKLV